MIYHATQIFIHKAANEHLDLTKAVSFQVTSATDTVIQKVNFLREWCASSYSLSLRQTAEKFTLLQLYRNIWPARDILQLHLKYTSSRERLHELERQAGKGAVKTVSSIHLSRYKTLKYIRFAADEASLTGQSNAVLESKWNESNISAYSISTS